MLECLIDNIVVMSVGRVFQQTVGMYDYGYQICPSSRRLVLLFVRDKLLAGTSEEKGKDANPVL